MITDSLCLYYKTDHLTICGQAAVFSVHEQHQHAGSDVSSQGRNYFFSSCIKICLMLVLIQN